MSNPFLARSQSAIILIVLGLLCFGLGVGQLLFFGPGLALESSGASSGLVQIFLSGIPSLILGYILVLLGVFLTSKRLLLLGFILATVLALYAEIMHPI